MVKEIHEQSRAAYTAFCILKDLRGRRGVHFDGGYDFLEEIQRAIQEGIECQYGCDVNEDEDLSKHSKRVMSDTHTFEPDQKYPWACARCGYFASERLKHHGIDEVYCWANGMTMVFDMHGQQMPEYQGRTGEVMPKIRAAGWMGEPINAVWPGFRVEEKA